jgi:hypothetical protein
MSAQPLNTSISIFRNVRTQRNILRHESVAAIIKHLRPLIAIVPGKEITAGVLTRDTDTKDFSPYMGQAAFGAGRGFPIVVGTFKQLAFDNAQAYITDADFAFQIGSDKFLAATASTNATADLFGEAATALAAHSQHIDGV